MDVQRRLKKALAAVDAAQTRLRRARQELEDDTEIRRAMSELDDAEAEIKKALRALKE
jgi:hypothetical protein